MEFSYKIFTTPDRDWYILSICYGVGTKNATIETLYEGDSWIKVLNAFITHSNLQIPEILERDMDSGSYDPVNEDFE